MTPVVTDANTLVNFVHLDAVARRSLSLHRRADRRRSAHRPDGLARRRRGRRHGTDGGAALAPRTHVRALFQNSQMSFVLANVDRAPTSQFVTSFDVHGGFAPQVVQDPVTLEVSMPARIVLGPVDSLAQVTTGTPAARLRGALSLRRRPASAGARAGRGTDARPAPAHQSAGLRGDGRIRAGGLSADLRGLQRQRRPLPDPVSQAGRDGRPRTPRELDAAQVRVETTCR